MNNTSISTSSDCGLLAVHHLNAEARSAAAAFVAAGTAANTVRSYRSALAYWAGWLQLRYGYTLEAGPLADTVAVQFILIIWRVRQTETGLTYCRRRWMPRWSTQASKASSAP